MSDEKLIAKMQLENQLGFDDGIGPNELKALQDRQDAALATPSLLELGGRTFVLLPMSAKQLAGLQEYATTKYQATMTDQVTATVQAIVAARKADVDIPQDVLSLFVADANRVASTPSKKATPTWSDVAGWFTKLDGTRELAFYVLSLFPSGEPVTRDWVFEHVNEDTYLDVLTKVGESLKVGKLDPKSEQAGS